METKQNAGLTPYCESTLNLGPPVANSNWGADGQIIINGVSIAYIIMYIHIITGICKQLF